ncbi:ABC transporter ATP-binding protein [Adhaeribacter terrigena]|nr:ABC transporter ATP-binding protein [Adhaeribacter terrigena]
MILEVKDLVAGYEQMLIRNLFFSIPEPAFVAIIGHNGCGKSTLFKTFIHQIGYSGSISIMGRDLKKISNPAAQGILAHLPQKNVVSFPVKVKDLVVMGAYRKKSFFENYAPEDYETVAFLLEKLQISHLAERNFPDLSGGEQQMVWLAQLMLQDAQLCLLDEPTQQLDVYHKKKVFKLLASWVQENQKTVLCITHDLHNLHFMPGYLLNLSKPSPKLEVISAETVTENREFLESAPF